MAIPQISLNNNVEIPQLGFGVYQVDPAETERIVSDALAAGYRHIDTAAAYFNEEAVGRAIASSGIPRNEIFVTTKLWISDAGDDGARRGFERSRTKLGLDYIDLYLIHQPYGDVYGSWRTMEKIYAEGGARAIGVSNFAPDRYLDLVLHNQIVPVVNQVETHPFLQRAEEQQFLAKHGTILESWGPFAEGRNQLFTNVVLTKIGDQYGKTTAQVVLRWFIQRGIIVIPKSVRPERMAENLDIFDFELSETDMAAIATLGGDASLFIDHTTPEAVEMLVHALTIE